jgi:hypothetical protein
MKSDRARVGRSGAPAPAASTTPRAGRSRAAWIGRAFLSLAVLAVLAFTLHALHFSGASYTRSSSNLGNVFVAGNLTHTNSKNGQVMISATGFDPGDTSLGTMTITAAGDVTGTYTLSSSSLVNAPVTPALSDALNLTIEDITGTATTLYDGAVTDFDAVDLGSIAPAASRSYRVTLAYPDGPNDSTLQGATMTLVMQVDGVSP